MRFSFLLAVIAALTTSMSVTAPRRLAKHAAQVLLVRRVFTVMSSTAINPLPMSLADRASRGEIRYIQPTSKYMHVKIHVLENRSEGKGCYFRGHSNFAVEDSAGHCSSPAT
ncbi:uncharacterized protein EDB91DRAFT_1082129 [Suillus paluster]|uniref:uncharacterized protein n=1 Tax=Suillus paluster TaxID=48578 RepID=UPI001B884AA9|nr:uncharacterized protein EDB91DRAFT_1082129 [Suillus paluster]KAG1740155.1 hypothetical protein EDB91DRAFT_1082129 [Suillus paluster]